MRRQALLLPLMLLIVSLYLPAIAFAEDYTWSDNGDGTCTITDYTGSGGDVAIPDTLGGLTVTAVGGRAFFYCSSLTGDLIIPDSVTTIGDYAFSRCSSLTSVTIGNSVTSIGDFAFLFCFSLTSVTIPDSVTSIGYAAFSRCSSLTAITVDVANPAYSSIAGVLFNKSQTQLIQYPEGGAGGAYTIPDSVTSIGHKAFFTCSSLTSVTIPDSVTSIGYDAFSRCSSLTSITIPDSVTSIGYAAFRNCSSLTSITIPGSVTVIWGSTFSNCTSLTSITIPNSVTAIGDYAFSLCSSLTGVTIPSNVIYIGKSVFSDCNGLLDITVDVANPAYSSIAGVLFNKSQIQLIQYPGGKTGAYTIPDSVTTIGDQAFGHCYNLTGITIPNSVTSIGYAAFSSCSSLTSVTIPNSVTTIGDYAFRDCTSLTGVYFKGDAPVLGVSVFSGINDGGNAATVYYLSRTTGWETTYGGLPTALWQMSPVGMEEFALLGQYWHMTGCDETQLCSAADWYIDGTIDKLDLNQLAMSWMGEEMITDGPISAYVFEIEMSLSYDYGEGYASSVPVNYQFDAWMLVDDTVVSGTVETPEGVVYQAEMEVDDGENWLGIYAESASLGGLSDFTDGDYIFTVTFANGKLQSTTISFEAQDGSPLMVPPRPVMTTPVHGSTDILLSTSFLIDPSNMTNPVWTYGLEYFPTDDDSSALSGEFENLPNTTTTVGPVDLSSNTEYEVELTANHAVWGTNDDGIPYVVDKDSEVEIIFTTGSE